MGGKTSTALRLARTNDPRVLAQTADEYLALFADRQDAFQRYWKGAWRAVREPLEAGTVVEAFVTGIPLGFYFGSSAGETRVGAIDFDGDDGWSQALAVAEILEEHILTPVLERSRRGAHLWLVIDGPVTMAEMRSVLRGAVRSAALDEENDHLELRPGSDRLEADQLGLGLRGPFMPHPLTGEAGMLVRPSDLRPLGDTVSDALKAVARSTPHALIAAYANLQRLPRVDQATPPVRPTGKAFFRNWKKSNTITSVLAAVYGITTQPGKTISCPFHADDHPSFTISAYDTRVWCNAEGCVFHNGRLGHDPWDLATWRRSPSTRSGRAPRSASRSRGPPP